jgi:hypothetical protein
VALVGTLRPAASIRESEKKKLNRNENVQPREVNVWRFYEEIVFYIAWTVLVSLLRFDSCLKKKKREHQ